MQGWISLGRDRVWQLDVLVTALNAIDARFADGSLATERLLDALRDSGTDLNGKYLHLLEGGYLFTSDEQGGEFYDELPDGVRPELVVEAPAEVTGAPLRDRMAALADEIDELATPPPEPGPGPRTFTAWVRQVLELSDERGQTGLFAESRALLAYELQDLWRDPGAKLDPAGVVAVCEVLDNRARGLHAARVLNGRTAGAMVAIAALTRTQVAAQTDDIAITEVAGRLLTAVAEAPPGSDPATCLAALVGHTLDGDAPDAAAEVAADCHQSGQTLLTRALDSTDDSGDEFIEGLHRAALEFQACSLLARCVLDDGDDPVWQHTVDAAEDQATRIVAALLDLARDTTGEQTQVLMAEAGRIRREQGVPAARGYARGLVETEYRYPRTALGWLTAAAGDA